MKIHYSNRAPAVNLHYFILYLYKLFEALHGNGIYKKLFAVVEQETKALLL
jgi:hypothetical protein